METISTIPDIINIILGSILITIALLATFVIPLTNAYVRKNAPIAVTGIYWELQEHDVIKFVIQDVNRHIYGFGTIYEIGYFGGQISRIGIRCCASEWHVNDIVQSNDTIHHIVHSNVIGIVKSPKMETIVFKLCRL